MFTKFHTWIVMGNELSELRLLLRAYPAYPGSKFVIANTLPNGKSWSQMKFTLAKVLARE